MRILQTVVSANGFRETGYTAAKVELLDRLASLAAERSCDLLLLPAGFVIASDLESADSFIRKAARIGRRYGIAIVGGVDLPAAVRGRKMEKQKGKGDRLAVQTRRLPFLGFATEPSGSCHGLRASWRQVSTNNRDALDAPALDVAGRVLRLNGADLVVLVCGEMHSKRLREALASLHVSAVVVSGHRGLGQGLVPTLRAITRAAHVPAVHAQHLRGKGGSLHFVRASGSSVPEAVLDSLMVDGDIWAAAVVRVL